MTQANSVKGTVVVGMSGGVDSSVAALLLRDQGYRVIGMFMKNWDEKDPSGVCTSEADSEDARIVCEKLGIPFYAVEYVKEYMDNVFQDFVREYQAGHTPNPDILCNREIKFNVFLKQAIALGADFLATGHYARKVDRPEGAMLARGRDGNKDQSYFIYTLKKETLARVLFPIGEIEKPEVRELARANGLPTHDKKDSTGICFIGERDFPEFLAKYVKGSPGSFKTLNGETVGRHRGAVFYTPGQRRGLGLGGPGERWYVVDKDVEKNIVWVERGDDHPALYADYLIAVEESWVSGAAPDLDRAVSAGDRVSTLTAKIRYRQPDQKCRISRTEDGKLRVDFEVPQRAIAPRQSVVFYDGEICLGGAIIDSRGPSKYEQAKARA